MIPNQDTIRRTPRGNLRGKRLEGVTAFLRVPYAAPPVGSKRFAPPTPVPAWQGERDASRPGPIPPQLPSRLSRVMGDPPVAQDEDCLHLDIWVPDTAQESGPLPILAFIHGGAFMTGGGSLPMYRGHELARRAGVIVVNISYRVGVLGFLEIPGLAPANLGLQDQIAALQWIQENIAGLGGDPSAVTLIGQSAGGYTIATLMACPHTRSLFQRAVIMSAPLGLELPTAETSRQVQQRLLSLLNLDPQATSALRDLPLSTLLQAQGRLAKEWANSPDNVSPPFVPVADDHWITEDPLRALLEGRASPCPLILGYTREEMAAFYAGNEVLAAQASHLLKDRWLDQPVEERAAKLAAARARRAPGDDLAVLTDLGTVELFGEPTLQAARARSQQGQRTWVYRFDWQSPMAGLGACHCIDLPFLFGNFDDWQESPMVNTADRREIAHLAESFQDLIGSFARNGAPTAPGLPWWPPAEDDSLLILDRYLSIGRLLP